MTATDPKQPVDLLDKGHLFSGEVRESIIDERPAEVVKFWSILGSTTFVDYSPSKLRNVDV